MVSWKISGKRKDYAAGGRKTTAVIKAAVAADKG